MKLRTGDKVKVMSGKDKGKEGKITQVFVAENRLVVDGVNKSFKHMKANGQASKGQKIEYFGPIGAANVMLVCPKCGKSTRVSHKMLEDGKKARVCKHCKEVI